MTKLTSFSALVVLMLSAGSALAETYVVNVKRIDQDLYKTTDGFYIETQYCYHYTYGEEAILRYEQYSYDNKIIFDNDEVCDVKRVFK